MNIVEIVFSPTGGTEKAAHIIGRRWSDNTVKIDLSDSKIDFSKCAISKEDQVLAVRSWVSVPLSTKGEWIWQDMENFFYSLQ